MDSEIATLKAENLALAQKLEAHKRTRAATNWRRTGFVVLLVLAVIMTPLSVTAVWANNTIASTNRFADTVAPLTDNPAIQDAVSLRLTNELFQQVDVTQEIQQALPNNASFLASTLTAQLKTVVQQTIKTVMGTQQFKQAWVAATKTAHEQVMQVLLNKKNAALQTNANGTVTLDLHQLAIQAQQQLSSSGLTIFDKLPADKVTGSIVLLNNPGVGRASTALRLLNAAAWVLPLITVLLFVGALWLAPNRRNGVIAASLAAGASLLVVITALKVGQSIFTTDVSRAADISTAAASVLYETVTRFLLRSSEAILTLGIVIALVTYLTGPYRWSLALRNAIDRFSDQKNINELGSVSRFVLQYRTMLRVAAVLIPVLALVLWSKPTPLVVILWAVIALLALGVIELLAPQRTHHSGHKRSTHVKPT